LDVDDDDQNLSSKSWTATRTAGDKAYHFPCSKLNESTILIMADGDIRFKEDKK